MKYWLIGVFVILFAVGLLAILFYSIGLFAIVFISLLIIIGAYPLGKEVSKHFNDIRNEICKETSNNRSHTV